MAETVPELDEQVAKDLLNIFINTVSETGQVDTVPQFMDIIGKSSLVDALDSLIQIHGRARPKFPGTTDFRTKDVGWKLTASVGEREDGIRWTEIERKRFSFLSGKIVKTALIIPENDFIHSAAREDGLPGCQGLLLPVQATWFYQNGWSQAGDNPFELEPHAGMRRRTSGSLIAADARDRTNEILTGYLSVSAYLAERLLLNI